jgi:hypothetical protein
MHQMRISTTFCELCHEQTCDPWCCKRVVHAKKPQNRNRIFPGQIFFQIILVKNDLINISACFTCNPIRCLWFMLVVLADEEIDSQKSSNYLRHQNCPQKIYISIKYTILFYHEYRYRYMQVFKLWIHWFVEIILFFIYICLYNLTIVEVRFYFHINMYWSCTGIAWRILCHNQKCNSVKQKELVVSIYWACCIH